MRIAVTLHEDAFLNFLNHIATQSLAITFGAAWAWKPMEKTMKQF